MAESGGDDRSAGGSGLLCPVERVEQVLILRPTGELNLTTAPVLRTIVLKSLSEDPDGIVIDLHHLTVAEDTSLTVFVAIGRRAGKWPGCPVVLSRPRDVVAERLRLLPVGRQVAVRERLPEAVALAGSLVASLTVRAGLRPQLSSIPRARRLAAEACGSWSVSAELCLRVQLVVTELVANAVRHAGTDVQLTVRRGPRYVHVAVRDGSPTLARLTTPDGENAPVGRGLLLVDAVSAAWDSIASRTGKVTWATVRIED